VKEIKITLSQFSSDSKALDKAYTRILKNMEHHPSARKILTWITFATRPLSTAELCCAVAVESGGTELDPDNVLEVEDLLALCAGFVVFDEKQDIVRLRHYTTQKYLEAASMTWAPAPQLLIITTCLDYLSFDVFKVGECETPHDLQDRLEDNHLLSYAANHWGEHARAVEAQAIVNVVTRFLMHTGLVTCATQVQESRGPYQFHVSKSTALHAAARLGIVEIAQNLATATEDRLTSIEARDIMNRTPLVVAAEHGHADMAEWLLGEGANVDAECQGQMIETYKALIAASSNGHTKVVKLLLDHGATKDQQRPCGGHHICGPLYEAAFEGHQQTVELLLDRGAEIDQVTSWGINALQAACTAANQAMVALLLARGANVNVGHALYVASNSGNTAIATMILNKGADPNAQYKDRGNALHAAARNGHVEIVKLLLDRGADIKAPSSEHRRALALAAGAGHLDTVTLLLDRGANINAQSGCCSSALQQACACGSFPVVQLLLDRGADVNACPPGGDTALLIASRSTINALQELWLNEAQMLMPRDARATHSAWLLAGGAPISSTTKSIEALLMPMIYQTTEAAF